MKALHLFVFLISLPLISLANNAEEVERYYRYFERYKETNDSLKKENLNKAYEILENDATIELNKVNGLVYFNKAYDYYNSGQYNECLYSFLESEKNFLYASDSCLLKDVYFNIGNVISVLGNNRVAIDYFQKSNEIKGCESSGTSEMLFHYNLGLLLSSIKLHEDALKEFETAVTFDYQTESDELNYYLAQMAINFEKFKMGKVDEALDGHRKILQDSFSLKYPEDILYYGYREMGSFYIEKGLLDSAESYFVKARDIEKTGYLDEYRSMDLINLMELNLAKENYQEVINVGSEATALCDELGNNERTRKVLKLLIPAYQKTENWEAAFVEQTKLAQLKDSLQAENTRLNYLVDEINKTRRNEIKLKENINVKKDDIDSLRNWLIWLGSILVLISILVFVLLKSRNRNKVLNAELSASNDHKDKILRTLTHDIRAPLVDATNLLKLFEMKVLSDDEKDKMIKRVKTKVDSLRLNVDTILHWSLSQIKDASVLKERIKISELINDTVSFVENQALAKEIKIHQPNIASDLVAEVDQKHLDIVLRNILGNAIKFSPINSDIWLSTSDTDDHIDIHIKDNGPGLSETDIQKIITGETISKEKQRKSSTGIGLKLTRQYLALNNGVLLVESTVGEGATFTVRLKKTA